MNTTPFFLTCLLCISVLKLIPAHGAQMLIPLYVWPVDNQGNCSPEWIKIINSQVAAQISVIVNPANGPVSKLVDYWIWFAYNKCIKEARDKGVTVYGYVHTKTGYDTGALNGWRDSTQVISDIDIWGSEYTVDGIFIDETSTRWLLAFETSRQDTVTRYQNYIDYILQKSTWSVFLNPGTPFFEELLTYRQDTRVKAVIREDVYQLWNPNDGCLNHL